MYGFRIAAAAPLPASTLARLLDGHRSLKLVVLNSCEGRGGVLEQLVNECLLVKHLARPRVDEASNRPLGVGGMPQNDEHQGEHFH